jgi:hypothetical protein
LNDAAVAVSRRLVESPEVAARWIGREALKELTGPVVRRQLAARRKAAAVKAVKAVKAAKAVNAK